MAVTDKQRRYLKGLAHTLKPVVMIGNSGLTESVLAEIDNALEHHELIKVRVSGQERADRKAMLDKIAEEHEVTNAAVALAWIINRPGVTAPIASATKSSHIEAFDEAIQLQLSEDEMNKLNEVSKK